ARLCRPCLIAAISLIVFTTEPTKAEVTKAKKEKKKPEDMPKNGLSIMDLSNGTVKHIERVKTFRVPEDAGGFIAYQLEPTPPTRPDSGSGQRTEPSPTPPSTEPSP